MDKCLFISKSALINNIEFYLKNTKKNIIAVIKNNAYGHGVENIISILEMQKIKMYAVSNLDEAINVRKYTDKDILIMDKIDDYKSLDKEMVITVISKKHLLEIIELNFSLRIHLKINVGMKRKGINQNELNECLELIKKSNLKLEGIYTHYSTCKLRKLKKEFNLFSAIIKDIKKDNLLIHASSSVSSLILKEEVTDTIRIGVGMYGLKKIVKEMEPLKVVSELKCSIKNSYVIKRFDSFSYDNKYYGKKGYIYMVNLGYGDGLFYKYKLKGYIEGRYIKEIGTRNMDNMYFYSEHYLMDNSVIEIYGEHNKIDTISKKTKIAVCRLLALLNVGIHKQIID